MSYGMAARFPDMMGCNYRISPQVEGHRMYAQHNTIRRVNRAGGLIGLWKTQEHNVTDQVDYLNRNGYRVTFIVTDAWTLFQWIGAMLLLLCTVGIYTKTPGLLVVGERIALPAVPVQPEMVVTEAPAAVTGPAIRQIAVGTQKF